MEKLELKVKKLNNYIIIFKLNAQDLYTSSLSTSSFNIALKNKHYDKEYFKRNEYFKSNELYGDIDTLEQFKESIKLLFSENMCKLIDPTIKFTKGRIVKKTNKFSEFLIHFDKFVESFTHLFNINNSKISISDQNIIRDQMINSIKHKINEKISQLNAIYVNGGGLKFFKTKPKSDKDILKTIKQIPTNQNNILQIFKYLKLIQRKIDILTICNQGTSRESARKISQQEIKKQLKKSIAKINEIKENPQLSYNEKLRQISSIKRHVTELSSLIIPASLNERELSKIERNSLKSKSSPKSSNKRQLSKIERNSLKSKSSPTSSDKGELSRVKSDSLKSSSSPTSFDKGELSKIKSYSLKSSSSPTSSEKRQLSKIARGSPESKSSPTPSEKQLLEELKQIEEEMENYVYKS